MEKGAVEIMRKTVIVGNMQVLYEGTPEEIVALERLQESKQMINNICVHVNGEINPKELEDQIRKAIAESKHTIMR
jgi:tRNA(Ser,Leu) C12 N-acetylase TAN1